VGCHRAVAWVALGNKVLVDSILDDFKKADIDGKLRAMLAYLEKVTLSPSQVTARDAAQLLAAGVSRQAAVDALYVGYLFNIHDRMADTLGYQLQTDDYMQSPAVLLSKRGYRL
jgi:alkylhydroperoxidase family enzyme